jgi:hypothetical protein
MTKAADLYEIYLEVGQKKVFAVAVDWPGWCRFGPDEETAVQKLIEVAPRYAGIAGQARLAFAEPQSASQLKVIAHLEGNTTTDFGAPDGQLPDDWAPLAADELARYEKLLQACWHALDQAAERAIGKTLQKGPLGGGRALTKIVDHVVGSTEGYLSSLGWKFPAKKGETRAEHQARLQHEVIQGLTAAADGQIPRKGPRGGERWPPRYFVRRLAWHITDHVWEIEDRSASSS